MFNSAQQALKEAKQYRHKVHQAIDRMDQDLLMLRVVETNAMALRTAITNMAEKFDALAVHDVQDRIAFERMVLVGKALHNLLLAEISDDATLARLLSPHEETIC